MAKCIVWCRVSTTAQELESQKSQLIEMALKDGYSENDILFIGEKGASAIKMNELYQQEVNELLQTINNDALINCIYVWEVSRLARNDVAFALMKDTIIKKNIQLICKVPSIKLFEDNGTVNRGAELTLSLLITLARQEMEIKAKRFARGKEKKAEENKFSGGNIPYGYKIDKERDNLIVPDEIESEIVKEIYNLYEGGMAQAKIAKEISMKRGTYFTINMVNHVLRNEHYTGKRIQPDYSDKKISEKYINRLSKYARAYPQIISQEQFDRCRKIAEGNSKTLGKTRNIYFAEHLIKCPTCGSWWSASGSKSSYHCYQAYQAKEFFKYNYNTPLENKCANKTSLSINVLDSLLWHIAKHEESVAIINSKEEDKENYKTQIEKLRQQISPLEEGIKKIGLKKKRLSTVYINDEDFSEEDFNIAKAKFDKEINDLHFQIDEINLKIINLQKTIESIDSNINKRYSLTDLITDYKTSLDVIKEDLDTNSSDRIKYEIVHRQILRVEIEATKVNFKFGIGWRPAQGKLIKIATRRFEILAKDSNDNKTITMNFLFIPNNGKGGVIIDLRRSKTYTDDTQEIAFEDGKIQTFDVLKYNHLERFQDEGKIRRQEQKRKERYKEVEGMLSVREVQEMTGFSYGKVCFDIRKGNLKATQLGQRYFISQEDADNYAGN